MILFLSGVEVRLEPHAVHITNDAALQRLLNRQAEPATEKLVQEIISAYQQHYRQPFAINPDSLAVEIWGHVYVEQFAEYMERLIQSKLIEKILSPVKGICSVIDCGESGHDQNRWFWDLLAPFKSTIAGWLPVKQYPL
ncbi:hypothetical protein A8C56_22505 [Niabella ginsenosidivorans]|uniref:Uncharacterized protein n=1 Tax=Niabella ginsenosidivorans TaxID=1176587 RepID=A0A1A9I7T1_9BACT|nr:hypothetical protein [Niabella ginsenosidivorans]ANH83385.1 hypothetical protein A8C56_22505 [Niabella ginsenosidivorans]